jgi:hypothetical protein
MIKLEMDNQGVKVQMTFYDKVSFTNETDCHDIHEILLKGA